MTLLRRAPREVYRLYDEEDFFAAADQEERRESVTTAPPGGRRLRRIAGTTTLLAAIGATGGLIALNRAVSVAGAGRQLTAGLLAGTGSPAPSHASRTHVWWQPGGKRTPRDAAPTRQLTSAHAVRGIAAYARVSTIASVQPQRTPVELATPTASPDPAATVASSSRRSGQSEFGFER
jgi:hypothetical protein